ncbi:integrase core domain-containing protein [Streptomyces cylindrosporus]|uniref:integrase core domain-containing protein n=1 Tax=Streptomyces cylindrosporus TaxID=2927583 RepID=UPI0035576129
MRREKLDHSGPFADPAAAQTAIDAWVDTYNHTRPHQSLEMATPAQVFRPHTITSGASAPSAPLAAEPAPAPSEPMRLPVLPAPVRPRRAPRSRQWSSRR